MELTTYVVDNMLGSENSLYKKVFDEFERGQHARQRAAPYLRSVMNMHGATRPYVRTELTCF